MVSLHCDILIFLVSQRDGSASANSRNSRI